MLNILISLPGGDDRGYIYFVDSIGYKSNTLGYGVYTLGNFVFYQRSFYAYQSFGGAQVNGARIVYKVVNLGLGIN